MRLIKNWRKKVIIVLLVVVSLLLGEMAYSATDEDRRGFLLVGFDQLYEGTQELFAGLQELLGGIGEMAEGMYELEKALDEDVSGGLDEMQSGVEEEMVPGLDTILMGLADEAVPGLHEVSEGINEEMVPGLNEMVMGVKNEMKPGLEEMRKGLEEEMRPGLQEMQAGIHSEMVPGLVQLLDGLEREMKPGLEEMRQGTRQVKHYLDPERPTHINLENEPGEETTILYDLAYFQESIETELSPVEDLIGSGALDPFMEKMVEELVTGLIEGVAMLVDGSEEKLTALHGGLDEIHTGQSELIRGIGDAENEESIIGGLTALKGGLEEEFSPGIDMMIDGLGRRTEDVSMVGGLSVLLNALGEEEDPESLIGGLNTVHNVLDEEVGPGLGELHSELTQTQHPGGYAWVQQQVGAFPDPDLPGANGEGGMGLMEGLTQIRLGLSNPQFRPEPAPLPGQDPGVADGLGMVLEGLDEEAIPGIREMHAGTTEQAMPGLDEATTGIRGEMQPGIAQLSTLVTVLLLAFVGLIAGLIIGKIIVILVNKKRESQQPGNPADCSPGSTSE